MSFGQKPIKKDDDASLKGSPDNILWTPVSAQLRRSEGACYQAERVITTTDEESKSCEFDNHNDGTTIFSPSECDSSNVKR